MEIPVYNLAGEVVRQIRVSDDVFAVPFNEAVVHQAVVRQQANSRQGTASTKTRAEVAGSGRKLYRQKHTGESRAGDIRSPLRRHGGITFGPKPRDYRQEMPREMRRLAIRCALSDKAGSGDLLVLEALDFAAPRTKEMVGILNALKIEGSTLIATEERRENVIKSARNLPGIRVALANLLSVLDIMSCKKLLMTEAGVRKIESLWGRKAA
ncbi:MAG: 50S ribosomal protein L4 [Chloroflexota bacterium]